MAATLQKKPLSMLERAQLEQERDQLRLRLIETQKEYQTVQGSIPPFQQLVLTTHAQVAAAKQTLLQARGTSTTSSCSTTPSPTTSMTMFTWPPSACSSPTQSSPALSRAPSFSNVLPPQQQHQESAAVSSETTTLMTQETITRLEQEHFALGLKLSQLLREKAEAEETKKKLGDGMNRAKVRIREIEQKLAE
ncbi:hypothetical protein BGZ94_009571 [Podila epigama]|nr:hypothetical protein BGZ94_009571 [Podila epigama]